ncbi:uncharacterized protein PV07_12334 [Cladophialophora immunda]|uniref:Uncharacterized protein n=1 Tax=Cladophialophora immunda TaxID=569365 RepID=A0A0D2BVL0_9EURO|nr:uncharacterized protein PV07_12334 [Cladophialophora immunda]KIW22450.1 hypothetical protein PV07_12334 [Cladophialophora immunda]
MRLLEIGDRGELSLTDDLAADIPPYAILSHTWGPDKEEVTAKDLIDGLGAGKEGYNKIQFCADRARKDGLRHFWIDTCCIDKTNLVELSEAIVSMFRWYTEAQKCYVFLSDVSACKRDHTGDTTQIWESAFRKSRWFTRGWTLQELLAPEQVEFYSREGVPLGNKDTLGQVVSEMTRIPEIALRGKPLKDFTHEERMRWASGRETKRTEDRAYCLLGIFDVSMPPIYGEGDKAFDRLKDEIAKAYRRQLEGIGQGPVPSNSSNLVVRSLRSTSNSIVEPTLLDRRKMILASLGFDQMDSRRSTIKPAYSTTCQWLLKHSAYRDWNDPEQIHHHRGFLWINGKPGAGKSTLVKFALARAAKARPESEILLSFFFNARGDELEYSTVGMYRALLFQLLTATADLQELLDDLDDMEDRGDSSVWTTERLCGLLSAAVTRLGHRRLKCFIDALDECDEQQIQDMVFFFEELGQTALDHGTQLYVCFVSRHYPTIDIRNGGQLTLEYEDGHAEDLGKYIQSHLRAGKGKVIEEVRTQIREKANGVFLWAVLVIPMLNEEFKRGRIFAVKKKLQEIPAELSKLFKDILRKDCANMDDLLLCLQWILFAHRPLRREEFYFAMLAGLDPGSEFMTAWNPEEITTDYMNRFVLNSSKGLAELTKSKMPTVQFIHESVRDFLLKDNGLSELWPDFGNGTNFEGESQQRLTGCCLNYINIDITSRLGNLDSLPKAATKEAAYLRESAAETFPFLEYAVQNVLWHADKAQANGVDQRYFLSTFQLAEWVCIDNLFERHEVRRHTPSVAFLYILAENNLSSLIGIHSSKSSCFDIEDERYGLPILAALATGSDEAVRTLLGVDAGTQPTMSPFPNLYEQYCRPGNKRINVPRTFAFSRKKGLLRAIAEHGDDLLLEFLCSSTKVNIEWTDNVSRALISAAKRGLKALTRLLLEKGADKESKDNGGQTPLSLAARQGHKEVVRLLLETGAERESKNNGGWTPLLLAARQGHEEDNGGQTPLSLAARQGHKEVVRLLLETGAERESKNNGGWTPLLLAARQGHEEVVRLLLETGAKRESKENGGQTPLSWAAEKGHEEVVRLLLETGADLESKDNRGRTPLSWAASREQEGVVRLLLETGADHECTDDEGLTPLSRAARNGHETVVKLLRSHQEKVDSFLGIAHMD